MNRPFSHHDDVIKWNHFPRYWPFVRWIHRAPVSRSFDVCFGLRLNKRLSKQSRRRWFDTPLCSLWRHCDAAQDCPGSYRHRTGLVMGMCSISNQMEIKCSSLLGQLSWYHIFYSNQWISFENGVPEDTLLWRHNGCDSASNHQPHDSLLNRLFRQQIKENIHAPHHWPLCGEFTGDRWIPCTKGQ